MTRKEGSGRPATPRGSDAEAVTQRAIPLAYLLTVNCYGHCFHGEQNGSVDRWHNVFGKDFLPPQPGRKTAEKELMDQEPYEMDQPRRQCVLEAVRGVCEHRGWGLPALHVRPFHFHAVVHAVAAPEKVLNDFKSYASRSLYRAGYEDSSRKRWARHGSTVYLWKTTDVAAAIHYVLHEQGQSMEVSEGPMFPDAHAPR